MTPFLTPRAVAISFVVFCTIYAVIFLFGVYYVHRLLRIGPAIAPVGSPGVAVRSRTQSVVDGPFGSQALKEE